MSLYDASTCELLDEDCICLKGFNISFSWDYPENWCIKDVQENVFHIYDAADLSKPDNDALINSIQTSGTEVVLTQPNPDRDVVPCELTLKAHRESAQFYITNIMVISESRHIELYVNDMYDKTFKGTVLSMKKGKKPAIYESQIDLSAHLQGTEKVTLKFLSLGDKESMRLQGIVLTIIECATPGIVPPKKSTSSTDVDCVREMMRSMNFQVSNEAEQLMKNIESQQKQNLLLQNLNGVNPQQLLQLSQLFQPQLATAFNNITSTPQTNKQPDLTTFAAQLNGTSTPTLPVNTNIKPSQLAALKTFLTSQTPTPVNNQDLPAPSISMPSTSPLSNQQPSCCAHAQTYPRQHRQQQNGLLPHQMQQLHISNNNNSNNNNYISNNYERTFSKSCPGSRNGSPTQHSCTHCPLHNGGGGGQLSGQLSPSRASSSGYGTSSGCYSEDDYTASSYMKTSNRVYDNNGGFTANGHVIENTTTCFTSPNPPHESVLANALLNDRPSKEYSRNRISLIEQENYREAQVQLHQNSYLHQPDGTVLSRGSVKLRHADNMSRKCLSERKRRAKSLCSMPTESELDFSQLMTEIIKDEAKNDKSSKAVNVIEDDSDSKISARWESYLRSRVRASRRNSDSNDQHQVQQPQQQPPQIVNGYHNGYHDYSTNRLKADNGATENGLRCQECNGCNRIHRRLDELTDSLVLMEQKLTSRIDSRIDELRHHLDKRLDTLLEVINVVPQPYEYDETLCSNTEV